MNFPTATFEASLFKPLGLVFFSGLFGWILWPDATAAQSSDWWKGLLFSLFFVFLGVGIGWKMLFRPAKLQIDKHGVTWRNRTIPWNCIEDIRTFRIKHQRIIAIDVNSPSTYGLQPKRHWWARLNRFFGSGDIEINGTLLDGSTEEIVGCLIEAWEYAKQHES